ncbi:MAG: MerR family transcriptional regulator, partial [Nostoc sp.]
MSVIEQFTRRETMDLTGATSNQLQYLERAGLVMPAREWNGKKKPEVYYNWQQVLDIRAIRNLREKTSLQVIRKILEFFEEYQIDKSLRDKRIVVVDDQVLWVKHDWSDLGKQISEQISALKVADKRGKGIGQYTLLVIPAFIDIVDEIWRAAEKSHVID